MTSTMTTPAFRSSSAPVTTPLEKRSAAPGTAGTAHHRAHSPAVGGGRASTIGTGRDARRVSGSVRTRQPHRAVHAGVAPRGRAEIVVERGTSTRPVGTRCAGGVGELTAARRRRAAVLAVLAGIGLALTVWVVGVVGADYQRASAPAATSTQVVHVRAGESLSSIAARVAPDAPRQTVIDEIIDLNDLPSSGLRVGQPLLAPTYR
ncbi:LysM peptidoglycan-binding domain-containing protein [Gordonia aichiensis]|uniref:LysM peptidoglycan-binding domain-containing protein n=1 Tax=Gordonia aichiensis TaxID=36820 RepID=UPI00034508A4|nr:LysM peptidoglycan-binding domain-containing protein [Gordonia aichiensis]